MESNKKRRGFDAGINSQQRREDFENEDSDDGNNTSQNNTTKGFERAGVSDLKNRKIVTFKRRTPVEASNPATETQTNGSSNAFAGINLLASSNEGNDRNKTNSNPFAQVNLLTSSENSSKINDTNTTQSKTVTNPSAFGNLNTPTDAQSREFTARTTSYAKLISENTNNGRLVLVATRDYLAYVERLFGSKTEDHDA